MHKEERSIACTSNQVIPAQSTYHTSKKEMLMINLVKLLEPIYKVLRYVDTRVCTAGDLYTDLYNLRCSK